jgi:tetratricopeptide (TPR) repeat protein
MLSELLAGRHALLDLEQTHSQAVWRQAHLNPQPRSLRAVEPRIPARIEALYQRCLAVDPAARPSAAEALAELQAGAREAGTAVYTPAELTPHTRFNEFVHWHQWSNACCNFQRYAEALERSDRALPLARQMVAERPQVLPDTLNTRGTILVGLGGAALERAAQARANGDAAGAAQAEREAAAHDQQAEATFQEALAAYPPETTAEGRDGGASVWNQLGVFHAERRRHAKAEMAFAHVLALKPGAADTYHNRAANLRMWGVATAQAGEREEAIAHLRQARVQALAALGLRFAPARGLIERIEATLAQVERLG